MDFGIQVGFPLRPSTKGTRTNSNRHTPCRLLLRQQAGGRSQGPEAPKLQQGQPPVPAPPCPASRTVDASMGDFPGGEPAHFAGNAWGLLFYQAPFVICSPTAKSFGVSAQIGSGVVRGGPERRFHEGSTRAPPRLKRAPHAVGDIT